MSTVSSSNLEYSSVERNPLFSYCGDGKVPDFSQASCLCRRDRGGIYKTIGISGAGVDRILAGPEKGFEFFEVFYRKGDWLYRDGKKYGVVEAKDVSGYPWVSTIIYAIGIALGIFLGWYFWGRGGRGGKGGGTGTGRGGKTSRGLLRRLFGKKYSVQVDWPSSTVVGQAVKVESVGNRVLTGARGVVGRVAGTHFVQATQLSFMRFAPCLPRIGFLRR